MTSVARRVLGVARVGQAAAISSICLGIAALYWNGVRFCGGGLRQLFLPERVTFGDGRVQSYVPNCPGHEVHVLGLGVVSVVAGILVLAGMRWLLATMKINTRTATTVAMWGIGVALLGIGVIPVENYAVGDFIDPTKHVGLWSRVSRLPGALLAIGGTVAAIVALRRRLR